MLPLLILYQLRCRVNIIACLRGAKSLFLIFPSLREAIDCCGKIVY
jgi:hypothetical protein